jgi:hypothetical protein
LDNNLAHISTVELRKRLIDKIQKIDNENLLEEAYRLLEGETEDIEIYKLSDEQRNVVNEAREQIKNGKFLTDDQANKEIDEWLTSSLVSPGTDRQERDLELLETTKSNSYSKKLNQLFKESVKIITDFPQIGKSTDEANTRIKM